MSDSIWFENSFSVDGIDAQSDNTLLVSVASYKPDHVSIEVYNDDEIMTVRLNERQVSDLICFLQHKKHELIASQRAS